jgi:hypothetical protein
MNEANKEQLQSYLEKLSSAEGSELASRVEKYFDDEAIEIVIDYIEDFYGVEDDEELGMLAQIMISGFITAIEYQQQ